MDDMQIVDLFWARSESAISETELKYGRYCRYIAKNILVDEDDANEVVNDTYMKLWEVIPPERPETFRTFIGMICRNLSLNRLKSRERHFGKEQTTALDEIADVLPDKDGGDDFADTVALGELLDSFLGSLTPKARVIFMQRYWYMQTLIQIAEATGTTVNAVSVSLASSRKKLRKLLKKEGFFYD